MEAQITRFALKEPVMEEEIALAPLHHELATKASRLLGYGLFAEHLQGPLAQITLDHVELKNLSHVFQELNINPYVVPEVEQYQRSEQRKLNFKSLLTLPWYAQAYVLSMKLISKIEGIVPRKMEMTVFLTVLIGGCVGIATFFSGHWQVGIVLSPLTFLLLCGIYVCNAPDKIQEMTLQEWQWKKLTFAECHAQKVEIPLFALDTAVRIKERIPNADLYVEALVSTEDSIGDPFLCLTHGGVKYYLEVWEENRFERKARKRS